MNNETNANPGPSPQAALDQIRSLQEELSATRATLEHERATARRFARRLSHDFRIPLNAMLGFSQLLQTSMRENLDSLEKVLNAGSHMLELIEDMGTEAYEADDSIDDTPKGRLLRRAAPEGALAATTASVRPPVAGTGGGGSVLYIEDQLTNVQMVELILGRHLGVAVAAVQTGREGINAARSQRPDLILLDLNLPDMHGSEVMERLRADPTVADIPIIILSSDAAPSQIDRMLAQGARNYLVKPFKMERLKEAVGEILREVQDRKS